MVEENTQVAKVVKKGNLLSVDDGQFSHLLDTAKFEQLQRAAILFSKTDIVPAHFRGKPQDCFVVMEMALRMGVAPMMLLQNTYVVHGKPGIEAKMAIALVNSRGPFTGPVQWELTGSGAGRQCRAYAIHKITGEVCEAECSVVMAKAEGWLKNPKWTSMTDLMLRYRSATFLARLYAPECLMGMSTADEVDDITPARPTFSGEIINDTDDINKQLGLAEKTPDDDRPDVVEQSQADDSMPAENARQADAKPVDAANDPMLPLMARLANQQGCSEDDAMVKLVDFVTKIYACKVSELTQKQIDDIKSKIDAGQLVVKQLESEAVHA